MCVEDFYRNVLCLTQEKRGDIVVVYPPLFNKINNNNIKRNIVEVVGGVESVEMCFNARI